MSKINEIILQKNWDSLIKDYSVKNVCSSLNFKEAMHVVKHLFYDDIQDDEKQQYALKLAFEIKDFFKNEWESDWKNDVFLGGLCAMLWLYDERYLCYKRAYDKLEDPPAELLLLLSDCNSAPGTPPITNEESEFYLRKAIEKKVTCEAAFTMRNLCKLKGDKSHAEYWDQIYKQLEEEKICSAQLIPDVLKK